MKSLCKSRLQQIQLDGLCVQIHGTTMTSLRMELHCQHFDADPTSENIETSSMISWIHYLRSISLSSSKINLFHMLK
jgi:hypothetical protein